MTDGGHGAVKAPLTPLQQGVWVLMCAFGGGRQNIHEDSCARSQLLLTFELSEKLNWKKKTSEPISGAEPTLLGYFRAHDHGVKSESGYFSCFALGLKYLMSLRCYCETLGHVILFYFLSGLQQKSLSDRIKASRPEWMEAARGAPLNLWHQTPHQSIKAACTEASAPKWPPSI